MDSVGPSVGSKNQNPFGIGRFIRRIGFPVIFAGPPLAFAAVFGRPLGVGGSVGPFWVLEACGCSM